MNESLASSTEVRISANESHVEKSKKRWTIVLYFSSFSGFFIGASGLLLNALEYLNFVKETSGWNEIGTGLIVVAFPLIMLGAHALDRLGELKHKHTENNNSISN